MRLLVLATLLTACSTTPTEAAPGAAAPLEAHDHRTLHDGQVGMYGEGAGTRSVMVEVTADGATFSLGFSAMPAACAEHGHEEGHGHEGR